jgi:hypothetical protein
VQDRRRVVEVAVALERAHHHGHAAGVAGQVAGAVDAALDERGLEEQVLGRVAGDDHLRERQQVDAQPPGALDPGADPRDVAVEVAYGGVDLGETDAQESHGPVSVHPLEHKRKRPAMDRAIPSLKRRGRGPDRVRKRERAARRLSPLPASDPAAGRDLSDPGLY